MPRRRKATTRPKSVDALSAKTLDEMERAAQKVAREKLRIEAALAAFTALVADPHPIADAARLAWDYADGFIEESERRAHGPAAGTPSVEP